MNPDSRLSNSRRASSSKKKRYGSFTGETSEDENNPALQSMLQIQRGLQESSHNKVAIQKEQAKLKRITK